MHQQRSALMKARGETCNAVIFFSSGPQPLTVRRDILVCCWITSKLVCSIFQVNECQCCQHNIPRVCASARDLLA